MSTTSMLARTTLRLALMVASASRRASGSGATATAVSVVVKGWGATGPCAPVSALNNEVLPELGRPTRPSRSIGRARYRVHRGRRPPVAWCAMSKRTTKRKIRSKKKANHGKRPNAGRG